MWIRFNSLFLYPHNETYLFLPPLSVFHTKIELSLEFTQRRLVHQRSFLTELLVGRQPYLTVSSQSYSTL